MAKASFLRKNFMRIKAFLHIFYYPQVEIEFPMDVLKQYIDYDWKLPEGYEVCSPDNTMNKQKWADLLNSDGGFGIWDEKRIENEIIARLITPDAASLIFYKDEMVGCFSTESQKTRRKRIGVGMFLLIKEQHRRKGLAKILLLRTMAFFARENFHKAILFTDPDRFPALSFYLSNAGQIKYNSLYSFFKWHKLHKKLKPLSMKT